MASETAQHALNERSAFLPDQGALPVVSSPGGALEPLLRPAATPGDTVRPGLRASLGRTLEREAARGTGFVSIPVLFGAGAAVYFLSERDPSIVLILALLFVALAIGMMAAHAGAARRVINRPREL